MVELSVNTLNPNELLGCELRVVRENPQAGQPLYLTATVISQQDNKVRVFDLSNSLLGIGLASPSASAT
ncbi:MAG: hypothetical protein H6841_06665 [Planctomycetes bacterium]|nr:hypothetical protein [Planctomycetota bacterium]MCB9936473.1 hypothetical protein [Planctomycetota bacterium]